MQNATLREYRRRCITVENIHVSNREFKKITTAGATAAAVTEKVWGEYGLVACQILAKRNTKMSET